MRRQVKPFVTEYRGSLRRGKDFPSPGDVEPESQASRSRSFVEAGRAFHSDVSEDSYEAALRAADALFASSASDASVARNDPRPVAPLPSRDALDETISDAFPAGISPEPPSAFVEREPTASPRRILQAIEPPAEDRFAELEVERSPKRRGRKPGSKNKPKIVVGDDWAASAPRPAAATAQALAPAEPAIQPPTPPFMASVPIPAPVGLQADPDDIETAMPQPRGRNDKFGWKRDGLRPGERWKRRLPKAAR